MERVRYSVDHAVYAMYARQGTRAIGKTKIREIVYCILSWEYCSGTMSDVGVDLDIHRLWQWNSITAGHDKSHYTMEARTVT